MKKILMIIGIAGCIAATGCAVDGYVTDQPADVYYERPVSPGPDYIWIDGDWTWGGGGYHWHNGYWGRPRAGRTWAPDTGTMVEEAITGIAATGGNCHSNGP